MMKNILLLLVVGFGILNSCKESDFRGWNNYPKYNTYLKVKVNEDFSKVLNCSVNGYEWKIKNEKAFKNIQLSKKMKQGENCSEIWKFKALKTGKDSIIFEYRKSINIIVRNTLIVDIQ